ncbi:formyltransferase family protein [Dietzia sp. CH92]|uniref:formyltransferase family protein n=1 Tax=Dietzia sp. CH92 TaxID=3051823 RepID=UPI0028D4732D|nr:formyltransferase family protein [Dietzia sp. CH92]
MRFGFVTCVELGLSCIDEVVSLGGKFDLLITLNDDKSITKSGRVYLDGIAAKHRIPLVKVDHINEPDSIAAIREARLDWLFIIGWSQIASEEVLNSAARGVLGMHPTLLPQGRGRAAVPWAIIKDLPHTGVTLFALDSGVDTGPIVDQVSIPLAPRETASSLYAKVNEAHRTLIRKAWPALVSGTCRFETQDESLATEWPARTPEDGRIVSTMTVAEVDRLVRAVTRPYPGAFWDQEGRRARVWAGGVQRSAVGALQIRVSDGLFYATEFEWE